jgi:hypothetical protein
METTSECTEWQEIFHTSGVEAAGVRSQSRGIGESPRQFRPFELTERNLGWCGVLERLSRPKVRKGASERVNLSSMALNNFLGEAETPQAWTCWIHKIQVRSVIYFWP